MAQPMSTKRNSLARTLLLPRWLLAGALLVGSVPMAWGGPAEQRIAYLNKKAMEDYDALEFNASRRGLEDAVAAVRKNGLETSNPRIAARTYINLGMVYVQLKDRGRGEQWFKRALAINAEAKLDPALATPDIQQVWDEARGVKAAPKPPEPVAQKPPEAPRPETPPEAPKPTQTDPLLAGGDTPSKPEVPKPNQNLEYSADDLLDPVKKVRLEHTPVEEIRTSTKGLVSVHPVPVHPEGTVARATLFYRGAGQEKFTESPMQPSKKVPGDWLGVISAEAAVGRALQYYVEAYDGKGRVCGNVGTAENPNITKVSQYAGIVAKQGEDIEDPLAYVKKEEERQRLSKLRDYVYIGVGVGTGGAVVPSGATTEVAWFYNSKLAVPKYEQARASNGGFVWGGLGIGAEIGAYLYRGLSIAVAGRFEALLNHNADSSENGQISPACVDASNKASPCFATTSKGQYGYIILGKLRYQFRQGSVFRPFIHLDAGGGEWRGALNIDGSRPMSGGQVDNSNPYQPTDVCSAQYNGKTDSTRDPANCNSIGGAIGYNRRDTTTGAPSNLNRVCPATGPCVDSVALNKIWLGGGLGFYAGGRHVGISLDVNVLGSLGGQSGALIDAYLGPQFIF